MWSPTSTHSSILSGSPSSGGPLSPCPVDEAILQRLADVLGRRPATEVTTLRGKGPTHSARVFCPRHQ